MHEQDYELYQEQKQHEATKRWMLEHGWSVSYSQDPADVYELLLEESDSENENENY